MRIAYITTYDANDRTPWSGLGHAILQSLRLQGFDVVPLGPMRNRLAWLGRQKGRFYYRLMGQSYEFEREALAAWDYALQIKRRLAREPFDIVFSPGAPEISRLRCRQPIVCWADATFASLINHYPSYQRLCRESVRSGHLTERSALQRCALTLFASEWAAQSAIADYGVESSKVKVAPFGANLNDPPSTAAALHSAAQRTMSGCRLISVGVDWERKGMPRAVALAALLNRRGIPTTLTIVGCRPPSGVVLPPFVRIVGFVSKHTVGGESLLARLFTEAHFHVLFSEAECFGVVFAEANAYAVPNIASDVGGIRSAIVDGRGGKCFSPSAPLDEIAEYVRAQMLEPGQYQQLAYAARREYDERLNWQVAGATVRRYLEALVPPGTSSV
jgi:glycosyltransferase involved in cell wall biosynthesis